MHSLQCLNLLYVYLHFRSLHGQFCKAQFVRNEQRVSKSICQSNYQWTVCRFHSSWCENHEETSPYTSWETQWMCTGAENYCAHLLRLQTIFPHIKITQTRFSFKRKNCLNYNSTSDDGGNRGQSKKGANISRIH